jgi:hypothetical protein
MVDRGDHDPTRRLVGKRTSIAVERRRLHTVAPSAGAGLAIRADGHRAEGLRLSHSVPSALVKNCHLHSRTLI